MSVVPSHWRVLQRRRVWGGRQSAEGQRAAALERPEAQREYKRKPVRRGELVGNRRELVVTEADQSVGFLVVYGSRLGVGAAEDDVQGAVRGWVDVPAEMHLILDELTGHPAAFRVRPGVMAPVRLGPATARSRPSRGFT